MARTEAEIREQMKSIENELSSLTTTDNASRRDKRAVKNRREELIRKHKSLDGSLQEAVFHRLKEQTRLENEAREKNKNETDRKYKAAEARYKNDPRLPKFIPPVARNQVYAQLAIDDGIWDSL